MKSGCRCTHICQCFTHPSLLACFSLTSMPSNLRQFPMWMSGIMKTDVLHVFDYVCTCMCVLCVVLNKDVLCEELVVNHWQCWQQTDKQIDPRPRREHRWHWSIHHTCTNTCVHASAHMQNGWPMVLRSGISLSSHVKICESY